MTPLTRKNTTLAIALGLPWPACIWVIVFGPGTLGPWTYTLAATLLIATAAFVFASQKNLDLGSASPLPVTRS